MLQIEIIESSILAVSFQNLESMERSNLTKNAFFSNNLWYDKSLTLIINKNGEILYMGEHSSYDGTVMVKLNKFLYDFSIKNLIKLDSN